LGIVILAEEENPQRQGSNLPPAFSVKKLTLSENPYCRSTERYSPVAAAKKPCEKREKGGSLSRRGFSVTTGQRE